MKSDLVNIIKSCALFSALKDAELKKLLPKFKKIQLRKDKILFKQGELSNHLYLLVSGKLAVFLNKKDKEKKLIDEVIPGQAIGELTALSHEPRPTTVKAAKHSVLLQLPSETFIDLTQQFPSVLSAVMDQSLGQSRKMIKLLSEKKEDKKHIAIVAANSKTDLHSFHNEIVKYLDKYPEIVFLSDLDPQSTHQNLSTLKKYVEKVDAENKTIIYIIQSYDSKLSEICFGLERVDMIYVVALADTANKKISKETLKKIDINSYKIKPELVLLHKDENKPPRQTIKWLKQARFNMQHHIRINRESDWQRLLRFITGNAVGLVLGGGGLRCWAHLGAIQALEKTGTPIDAIGGSSAGAIVAGYYALNGTFEQLESLRELSEKTRQSISLKNLTWPSASLFNGKEYTKTLQKIYGNVRIENLWMPFFCVVTNLSSNKSVNCRKGLLWKNIRSSTAVPVIFPPVVVNGKLFMDGGLLNNLPVDVMKKIIYGSGKKIIAIELTHMNEDVTHYNFPPILPLITTSIAKLKLAYKDYKFPHFIDNFLKSLLAGSAAKQEENGKAAEILVTPDLSNFGLLRIKKSDEALLTKIGYKETMKQLKSTHTK